MTSSHAATRRSFIHRRTIEVDLREGQGNSFVAEGRLTDTKGEPVTTYDGSVVPVGGQAHDMHVTLQLSSDDLTILDADVNMQAVPGAPCRAIIPSFVELIGLQVGPGYRSMLRECFGNVRGCTHVVELLSAMGPAIMQGAWTREFEQYRPDAMLRYAGTCHVYADDSETMRRLAEEARREA